MPFILYTSQNCPICKNVKELFDKYHLSYVEKSDSDSLQLLLTLGIKTIPALEYNGKYYTGKELRLIIVQLIEHSLVTQ